MKTFSPTGIFVVGSGIVLISCAIAVVVICAISDPQTPSSDDFSAMFTTLGTIYTGLGFAGLVAVYQHEREQSSATEEEHLRVVAEMRAEVAAMVKMAKGSAAAALLNHLHLEIDTLRRKSVLQDSEVELLTSLEERKSDMVRTLRDVL